MGKDSISVLTSGPGRAPPCPTQAIHTLGLAKRRWVHLCGDGFRQDELFL